MAYIRALSIVLLSALTLSVGETTFATDCSPPQQVTEATPEQVRTFFRTKRWKVVTFLGYSGAEYEDPESMLRHAARSLRSLDPRRTVINIGATSQGIGAVYELAKQRGFITTGVVSTQAKQQAVTLSPCVDFVFYVNDETWGGYLPRTTTLSPTSEAMVRSSDVLIAIGGGEVARDEMLAARPLGKRVKFIPADMNHRIAREKAEAKGLAPSTDFRGAAHAVFSPGT